MDEKQALLIQKKFKTVFGTDDGQYVLGAIYKYCGLLDEPFHTDPYKNAYEQGKRRTAMYIAGILGMDIEQTAKMISEYQSARKYNALRPARNTK